jgi:hypothetical protein
MEQLSFDFNTKKPEYNAEQTILKLATAGVPDGVLLKRFNQFRDNGTNFVFQQMNGALFCLTRLKASNPPLTEDQQRYISQTEKFLNNMYSTRK